LVNFEEKRGRGSVAPNLFGNLKRALEILISVRKSLFPELQDYWFDTITPEKKRIRDLSSGKKYKTHYFCRWGLENFTVSFLDTLNFSAVFSLRFLDF